jgi:hypothetical protein
MTASDQLTTRACEPVSTATAGLLHGTSEWWGLPYP